MPTAGLPRWRPAEATVWRHHEERLTPSRNVPSFTQPVVVRTWNFSPMPMMKAGHPWCHVSECFVLVNPGINGPFSSCWVGFQVITVMPVGTISNHERPRSNANAGAAQPQKCPRPASTLSSGNGPLQSPMPHDSCEIRPSRSFAPVQRRWARKSVAGNAPPAKTHFPKPVPTVDACHRISAPPPEGPPCDEINQGLVVNQRACHLPAQCSH